MILYILCFLFSPPPPARRWVLVFIACPPWCPLTLLCTSAGYTPTDDTPTEIHINRLHSNRLHNSDDTPSSAQHQPTTTHTLGLATLKCQLHWPRGVDLRPGNPQ